MKSHVTNSIIIDREPSTVGGLFVQTIDGDVLARLDRFLIIPIERVADIEAVLRSANINPDPAAFPV